MQRLFSIIIAGCLIFLAITSLMESKNSKIDIADSSSVEAARSSAPEDSDVLTPAQIPVAETPATQQPDIPQADNPDVDGDLEKLAAFTETTLGDEPPVQPTELRREKRSRYSKEKAWKYSTQAENDLAALDSLLTN